MKHGPKADEGMLSSLRKSADSMLPELNCFGRPGKPQASWGGATSGGSSLLMRTGKDETRSSGVVARRPTPPVERAFLRGGAREQPSLQSRGGGLSTYDRMGRSPASSVGARPTGGSRGALGGTSSVGGSRHLTTPPSRTVAGRRPAASASTGGEGSSSSNSSSSSVVGPPASAPPSSSSNAAPSGGVLKCDKCDGKHATESWYRPRSSRSNTTQRPHEQRGSSTPVPAARITASLLPSPRLLTFGRLCSSCAPAAHSPWFKKARDKHPDAKPLSEKKVGSNAAHAPSPLRPRVCGTTIPHLAFPPPRTASIAPLGALCPLV